jgi:aminoglycoside 6'-N-acetyltransferase I
MHLRPIDTADTAEWLALRRALWPDAPPAQLHEELTEIAGDPQQIAIGAFDAAGLIAFVELSIHPHAVGCRTRPVAYLEAWYVKADHRRTGVGRRLIDAGQAWARAYGCHELASDTWLDNDASHAAHLALGFTEATRLIHYRKPL